METLKEILTVIAIAFIPSIAILFLINEPIRPKNPIHFNKPDND